MTNTTKIVLLGACIISANAVLLRAQQPPPPPAPSTPATTASGPKIQFATPIYNFGKVKSGEPVRYSYVFTNGGDQLLEIRNVQPGCGCTAAGEWTKNVEPGKTGLIPIQFNSGNFNGNVTKTISVTSNDKQQPVVVLQLQGTIWKPIDYPNYTMINVPPDGTNASATAKIVNNMEEPLAIFSPESNNKSYVATIETNKPGKEYLVTIAGVPPFKPGQTPGQITVKTSSTNMPVITLPFWANVQAAIMVMPDQIHLPMGPLSIRQEPAFTIRNNSANKITLSEPDLNLAGVEMHIDELEPGRTFSVKFMFPAGFQVPPGQLARFTVKTSNPQYPMLSVPILQAPHPQPLAAPQGNLKPQAAFIPPPTLPGTPSRQ